VSVAVQTRMRGARKAAVLMIMLGEQIAADIYRTLPDRDVQAITEELAKIDRVPQEAAKQVLEEYNELSLTQEYLAQGGMDYAARLLVGAYGETRARELLDSVIRSQEVSASKLDSLQKADPQQLAKFLEGEHPQTIALILGHMDPRQASTLLERLPEQMRADSIKRLAQLRQFSPEMAEKVSIVLNRKLQGLGEQRHRTYAGFKSVADLMNRMEPGAAKEILESIEQDQPKLALSIRNLMFTFEDLLFVPEVGIRELVAIVDKKTLALALKGAQEDLKAHVFRTMSSRAVEMLKEDMDALGSVSRRDATKAQHEIISAARTLESQGKIVLRPEVDDEFVD
jgi:flagellar motor switch protein FliG